MDTSKRNSFIFNSKENRIFFAKAVGLFFGLLLFGAHVLPQFSGTYYAILIDKVAHLKATQGPKIVLLGPSNVALGYDSARIEQAFGMPVVNMGYSSEVGPVVAEEMARLNVDEGDIYVLEQIRYDDKLIDFRARVAWMAMENHWNLWPLLKYQTDGTARYPVREMISAFPAYIKSALVLYATGTGNIYSDDTWLSRLAFDQRGDNIFPRPDQEHEPLDDFQLQNAILTHVGDNTAARINALAAWLQERGATLVVTNFPIPDVVYTALQGEYETMQKELEDKLECPVISRLEENVFGYEHFLDFIHLTNNGKELKTDQFIKELQAWMAENEYQCPQ